MPVGSAHVAQVFMVGLGGFIGAVARYGISTLLQGRGAGWPLATLLVNVVGCLAIGALLGLARDNPDLSPQVRSFLVVGLLGSFTTFSTLGHETMQLVEEGNHGRALVLILLHLTLGLAAVWIGARATT